MNKYLNLISLFLLFSSFAVSQTKEFTITGKVVDDATDKPLQLVNVFLISSIDSTLVAGAATAKDGKFDIKKISNGKYFIKISSIGYKDYILDFDKSIQKNQKYDFGTIKLIPLIVDLNEVLVSTKKETFNNSIDRKVYNIENDIMSKTGTASELLQNIPSVQVDIEGNVTLRGGGNPVIMINGKTSPLLAKSAPAVLEQMPANSIEKIEVITNPSAKYKPDGNSGIINIVLKKNTEFGLNGTISANAGNKSRYNGNLALNYNPGQFNIFATYGLRQDDRSRSNTDSRQLFNPGSAAIYYNDKSHSSGRPLFQMASGGIDYSPDKANKIGISVNYMYHNFTRDEIVTKNTLNSNFILSEDYDRINSESQDEKELEASLIYQHNFPEEDHVLKAEFKYSYSPEYENNKYKNVYRLPFQMVSFDNTANYQTGLLKNIDIDYSRPLSETAALEAGYSGEFDTPEFSYRNEFYDDISKSFIKDLKKTNHYVMDEQINAFYTTLSKTIGPIGILAGIRFENSFVKSHLINNDSSIIKRENSIFPTMHLSYKITETDQIQLNYSKRINRPEGDDLNPFPEYQDPRNIRSGNPNLLPEFYHSVEFGYQKQFEHLTITPGIYYRYTNNKFTSVIRPLNDTVFLTTLQNLSSDQSAGFELVLSANYNGMLSSNLSANAFYSEIDASNIGYSKNKSTLAWSGSWNINFNVTKTTMLQMNSNFRSVRLTPQGEYNASYVVNFGCRQDLFDEKVSLILTISDLFNSLKRKMELNTPILKQNTISERDSRIIYLGLTYHFGSSDKKSKDRKLEYDDKL